MDPSAALERAILEAEVARRLELCDRYERALRHIERIGGHAGSVARLALADQQYVDTAAIADAMGEHEFAECVRAVRR